MNFVDTIYDVSMDTINYIPDELKMKINNIDMGFLYISKDTNILNNIWRIAYDLCKDNISMNYLTKVGFQEDMLFDDIKNHCIFTIFASIKFRNIPKKSLREILCDSKGITSKELFETNDYNEFYKKYKHFLNSIFNIDNFDFLDFCDCMDNSIAIASKGYKIEFYNSKLFTFFVENWIECPCINKNINNNSFERLCKYGSELIAILFKNSNELYEDKCLNAYVIERFFNISFINSLATFWKNEFINIKINNELFMKYISQLASIPMIFSRDKYLNIIYNRKKLNYEIDYVKRDFALRYLNHQVLPIITKVYYYLINLYARHLHSEDYQIVNYIEQQITEYINGNKDKYQYENIINGIKTLNNSSVSPEMQLNMSKLIYRTSKDIFIDKNEDYEKELYNDCLRNIYTED